MKRAIAVVGLGLLLAAGLSACSNTPGLWVDQNGDPCKWVDLNGNLVDFPVSTPDEDGNVSDEHPTPKFFTGAPR